MRIFFLISFLFSQTVWSSPDLSHWKQILKNSRGKEVTIALWSGSESINTWVDTFAATEIKKRYGITLKRYPIKDVSLAVKQLISDRKIGKTKGQFDLVWINGENFKVVKEKNLAWGPFAKQLPSVKKYFNLNDPDIWTDFGIPTEGYEVPWGVAQFTFFHNKKKVKNPPQSWAELKQWMKKNPGRFAYTAPPDFTGSVLLRQIFHEISPEGYAAFLKTKNHKDFKKITASLWEELRSIRPYLWRKGKFYPESISKLKQLFADGEVWLYMSYSPLTAQKEILKGTFPKTTGSFLFKKGTIFNTNYQLIPFNAPEKHAAAVVTDFFASYDAQLSKLEPKNWGGFPVLDYSKLSKEQLKRIQSVDMGEATLSIDYLAKHRIPELPAQYVPRFEKEWKRQVLRK